MMSELSNALSPIKKSLKLAKITRFAFWIQKVIFEAIEKPTFEIFLRSKKTSIFSKNFFQKMSSKKFSRGPIKNPRPVTLGKLILPDTMVTKSRRLEPY